MHQIQSAAASKPVRFEHYSFEISISLILTTVKIAIFFLSNYRNVNNLDTSVPSIHSSGCDSGVGLTTQLNAGASKQLVQMMRSSQRDRMITEKRVKRCVCGYAVAGAHVCNAGEESRYYYRLNVLLFEWKTLPTNMKKKLGEIILLKKFSLMKSGNFCHFCVFDKISAFSTLFKFFAH